MQFMVAGFGQSSRTARAPKNAVKSQSDKRSATSRSRKANRCYGSALLGLEPSLVLLASSALCDSQRWGS